MLAFLLLPLVVGTVGSTTYGVAKNTTLHNVRCLNAFGSGSFAGIINSIEFVVNLADDGGAKIISCVFISFRVVYIDCGRQNRVLELAFFFNRNCGKDCSLYEDVIFFLR